MTNIKQLTAKGFKSFANRTDLIFGDGFNCIIGPNGSGKCLVGDSLVLLADGSTTKIGDLVEAKLSKNKIGYFDDGLFALGDSTKILSLNPDTLKIEEKPVLSYVKRKSPKTLLRIKTRSGKRITSTEYHPLFCLKEGNLEAIKAEDLKEGVRIAVPRELPILRKTLYFLELLDLISEEDHVYVPYKEIYSGLLKKINHGEWRNTAQRIGVPLNAIKGLLSKQSINFVYLVKILRYAGFNDKEIINLIPYIKAKNQSKVYRMPWENSPDFSRFLGYLLAEGRISPSNQIWFTNGNEDVVDDYKTLAERLFEVKVSVNEYKANCWDVIFYSSPIIALLTKFGMSKEGTAGKTIPNLFLTHSSEQELSAILSGLYSGDGYVSKNTVEITTKSKNLAFAIETILLRLGISFITRDTIKIATNSGYSGHYKNVIIYGKNIEKFRQFVCLAHKPKQNRLESFGNKKYNPNVDLIEVNDLIKKVTNDLKINVKKTKKQFPKLDAYCYNQCLPSVMVVEDLIDRLFAKNGSSDSLIELKKLVDAQIYWDEVVELEKVISNEEWVYDLCVEGNHNFIAQNLFVHNSNVMDCLTFVLGKSSAKSMRAEKSANLIYNGGKKGNPAKEAEVSIVFSNDEKEFPLEDKEIVISRIVKQNGTSIYKLNGKTKTKQEIVDVLANGRVDPDGHNIILQGDIVHFMEMKPELRRELVEEIAGISIYDDKKEKAMHELEKVQEKLTEVDIILVEREAHLRELKKERDDAQTYKELQEKIKDNKATYLHMQIKKKEEKKDEVESKINEQEKRLKVIEDLIKEIKDLISKKREEIKSINQEIEEKGEKEQLALREEVSSLKEKIITYTSRLEVLENELRKIVERKQQLTRSVQETLEKVKGLGEQKKQLNHTLQDTYLQEEKQLREIRRYKESHGIEKLGDLGNQLNQMESSLEEKGSTLLHSQEEEQSLLRELDKVLFSLQALDDKIGKFNDKEGGEKLKHLRNQFKDVTKELGKAVNEDSAYAAQLGKARSKLYSMQEELARLSITQAGIKEAAGGDLAIKKIMELKGKGVYGTIAELGEVSKPHSLALEVAAGNRINSIVVNDETVGAKCIALLKEHKLGVATFLPLTTIKQRALEQEAVRLKNERGVLGLAIELIKYDKKFDSIFKYVFGSTLVVDDINVARRIGIGRARMVTLEGDLMEPSGAMVGGYRRAVSGKFHQKEVGGKISELEEEVERLRKIISTLEAKRNENESSLVMLREKKASLEGEIIRVEKSLGVEGDIQELREERRELLEKQKTLNQEIKRISGDKVIIEKELMRIKKERDSLREKLTSNPDIIEGLTVLEEKKNQLREESIRIKSEIKQLDHQISLLGEENEKIDRILKDHDKEKQDFLDEKQRLNDTLGTHTRELKEKQKLEQAFYGKFKSLALKRNKLEEEIIKKEEGIGQEEERYKGIEGKKHELSLVRAKFVAEMEGLEREFEDYKDGKIRRNISFEELKKEIDECDSILKKMGSVNMRALEIYEDVRKEYEHLVEKTGKLKEEKEAVLATMQEIEQQKIVEFMKTFKDLEKNFKEIFSTLSDKGDAQLVLENPESPLEGGLDIRVKITGNKFLDIRGLSGGEKTMTALAFIFAIQEFNPAPFYLLDEVDAALDKHNSDKLSKLIAKYAAGAQYIVISHNDYVITEAQQVYGVSMQEGVSKVISLKI